MDFLNVQSLYANGFQLLFFRKTILPKDILTKRIIMVDSTFSPEVYFFLGIVQIGAKKYLESAKNFSLQPKGVPDEKKHKGSKIIENMTFTYNAVLNPKPFKSDHLARCRIQ